METMIKKRFVGRILREEGERMLRNQSLVLDKRLTFHSGKLTGNRRTTVTEGNDFDGKLSFTHIAYERFLDMKRRVNRKRSLGSREKRGYRIHNRFIYGTYGSIARRLMYELTDDVRTSIINEIKSEQYG